MISSRRKHPKRYISDEEDVYTRILLVILIHVMLVLLRAAGVIMWPWWLILIPEILFVLLVAVLAVIGIYVVLRERIRRRNGYGE